jgi:dihydrofolate reductase
MNERKIIVHAAASADGYIARPDGSLDWLTSRRAPKGFYGMPTFIRSVDAKILGRKTFELSVAMGAHFGTDDPHYVFSHRPPPVSVPPGVHFVSAPIREFCQRLRTEKGKDVWMMGGGEIIASFLDEGEIDEFCVNVIPVFIGDGIPLIARHHREVPLRLQSATSFPDGVVQVRYLVQR